MILLRKSVTLALCYIIYVSVSLSIQSYADQNNLYCLTYAKLLK